METLTRDSQLTGKAGLPSVSVNERCVGCQECIIRCPTRALRLEPVKWVALADNSLCVGCRQCERVCPVAAINVKGPAVVARRIQVASHAGPVAKGEIKEVRPGFASYEEAVKEADRCLNCPDPTCVRGCPAHNDIPAFIEAIRNRDLRRAQAVLARTTCLPDVCSRVCDWANQCEGACSWALVGSEPVAIGKLERFVTDNSPVPPPARPAKQASGLSVGIIGSGPAGIAAALELSSAGASVTIYDRDGLGGVMRWGIPSYVLPDAVSRRPVAALIDAGVKIASGSTVSPETITDLLKAHDVVVAAPGAPVAERPQIPGAELEGVLDATTFLKKAKSALSEGKSMVEIEGATVAVLGGSNTAIDVARSVVRLGGRPVVVHRREERFSRSRLDELSEAKNEGVEFRFAANIARIEGENGKVSRAVLVRTHQKNASSAAEAIFGTESSLEVKMVVLATGYAIDRSFAPVFGQLPLAPQPAGTIPDRRWMASGILTDRNRVGRLAWEREFPLLVSGTPRRDKIWLIGDALTGPSTVVASMAQGKKAGRTILDKYSGK